MRRVPTRRGGRFGARSGDLRTALELDLAPAPDAGRRRGLGRRGGGVGSRVAAGLLVAVAAGLPAAGAQEPDSPPIPGASPVYEFRNGRWFDGEGFRSGTFYSRFGVLTRRAPATTDSVIDLEGRWVIPPYAEAHNHNVEASPRLDELIRRYLRAGVFYVKNPNALPRSALAIRHRVNLPTSIDAAFAMGGWTSPGGHPVGVVRRVVARGLWTEADGEGAFYYAVEDEADLDRRWSGFLALRPDFVKTYLLYSEDHGAIRDDPAHEGWRGLDPALLPEIVRRAHEAGLRVSAHVETATDLHHAVAGGVDEVAHLPGFRGDRNHLFPDPDVYRIREADARLAGERGVVVVTTLANYAGSAPDSVTGKAHEVWAHNLSLLRRHGVPIAIGSDGYDGVGVEEVIQVHGLGVLSPLELLRAWVETTPKTIFPRRKIGRLEEGFEASFLVLAGDPLQDFSATRDIVLRVKRGLILDPGPDPEARAEEGAAARAGAVAGASGGSGVTEACRAAREEILDELRRVHERQANVGLQAAMALGGDIVFSDALGLADLEHQVPVTRETRFGIASVTKAFTGTALLLAVEEGRIDLDAPVRRWVPEFKAKERGRVTPRMLAGHLGGIRHYRDERTPEFYASHYEDVRDALELYADDPLVAPPGTRYRYSSYGYNLLASAIQGATAVRFQDWVTDRILRKLGLERTRFDDVRFPVPDRSERYSYYHPTTYEESGEPYLVPRWDYSYNTAGGNLISTAEELARFGQAFTGPGLLSEASLARLERPIRVGEVTSEFTFGWGRPRTDDARRRFLRITGSNAGLQAALVVYPDEGLSVAVLSNTWGIGSRSAEMVVDLPGRMAALCLGG